LEADDIRALKLVADREKATSLGFGVFITLNDPTPGMIADAASAGTVEYHGRRYPYLQILRVADILQGKRPNLPLIDPTVAYRRRARAADIQQSLLE
jgi:site-specific DNA-methyltransferase (adenine-specific)